MPCRRTRSAPTKPITKRNPHRQTPNSHTTTIDELCAAVQAPAVFSKSTQLRRETATGADGIELAAGRCDEYGAIATGLEGDGNASSAVVADRPGELDVAASRPRFASTFAFGSVPSFKMA